MSVRVKICGITRLADALAAVEAGADALGFMLFAGSKRHVPAATVAAIVRDLPPLVTKVGVFVDAPADEVRRVAAQCGLDALQFHGRETVEYCAGFSDRVVIKAFAITDDSSLAALPAFPVNAWLLDSSVAGRFGGSGTTINWDLAARARVLGRPVILAGGLEPGNVTEAVRRVRPYAVDVSSGVESAPGLKDPARLRAFVAAAKAVVES